jgi:hypothetical protein
MKGGNVTQQIGQELPVLVKHADNTGLTNGKVVYQAGSDGSNVLVRYAAATAESTSSKTFGVMTESATGGDKAFCTTFGYVRNIDTSLLTEGSMIWLSETAGEMTTTRPTQPAHGVVVGRCIRQHATVGVIFVSIQNGFELDEIHDVLITSKANNEILTYESATNLWKNKTIAAILGYTPANDSGVVHIAGAETITGVKTFSSVINASTLSINGGTLVGNNIVSMRSNPTGGQFRVEKSDGSLSAYPFYVGVDGTALAYYYNAAGALKVLLHTNDTSYFGNSLSIGYASYAATSYMLDVNGTARFTNTVTIGNFDTLALRMQAGTSTGSSYLRFFNSAGTARGYFGLFWSGTSDYMVMDAGALEMNFGSSNKFTFTGGGPAIFSGALSTAGDVTISTGSIKLYTQQNVPGQYRYIGTEYASGNGNNKAEIRFGIDGSDTRTKITLHTANGGGQINEIFGGYASGQFKFNNYTSATSFSGTAAGYLAFDSSGNVITVAGVAATDNTKLPLAGGTMTGIIGFTNTVGNKIDFYFSGEDRYGIQVQSSELRIHSGAQGAASGGITFGKSTSTTFTEYLRIRNDGDIQAVGSLFMGTSGTSYIRMGRFPNSVSNSGEAWIGRASDRNAGTMTVQLGGSSNASFFEVVDYGWTTVTLKVGMNDFSYKGNVVIHAGNISSQSVSYASTAGTASNISAYTINQNLGTGNDVTHAILRASSYIVTPLIYSGGGNVVLGNNLQVGSGLSTNSTYEANFFGRFTPDGKYLTRNWQLNDGGYTWSNLNYTQVSDSPIGSYTMRGNNNSSTNQRQSGWVAIDRTKTYKVSVWYRTISGSPLVYLSFTQAGWDLSQPDNGGWGQPYFAIVNTSSTAWQEFTMTIGPSGSGAGYTWYSYARYAQLGVLMNYNNSGNAEITGFKMEEVDSTLANNTTVLGDSLYVGTSTSSNIYMTDSDESTRRIHCNSGRIGFLNTSASWGAYCDNSGNWISDSSLRAPIFYDSNDTSYYLDPNSTGTSLNVAGTVRGSYFIASNYSSTGYTQYKGYDNNNHFIMVRGRVTGNTSSPTYTGYHRTSLVEYAEANDDTGWFFQTAATGNYDIVARITRSYSQFEGSVRAPIFYDSNDTGYYADFASTSRMNAIVYNDLKWAGDQSYGFLGRNVYADTINGRGSDPLEINYYDGGDVRIGQGVNGNKGLYAGALYDAGSRVAISRGEGRNYVDYSRYVYNNGAYSGSGWIEPSDLGVRYANSAGSLSGFDKTNPSFGAVYASNWFRAQGDCGLYSQDYGGHIRRALTGSYGNWETFGYNRNGWSGFLNLNNYNLNLMMNSSGDHGFYMENGSGWTFFFNRGNHCAGIGTDNTWSGDGLRVVKQISAEYGFTTWSDRRAKENISNITSALDKVLQMRGVYFNYIKDNAKVKRVGFIAQELQAVLPEVVNYAEEIDEYNVNYGQIVSVLTEATKEQNDMIISQATRIEQLELLVQQLINSNNGISN